MTDPYQQMSNTYCQPEDLLTDPTFIAWYRRSDARSYEEWEMRMDEDPQLRRLADQAMDLLQMLHVDERQVPAWQLNAAEHGLIRKLQSRDNGPTRFYRRLKPLLVAACIAVIAVAGFMIFKPSRSAPAIKTNYGEITEQKLPDGTEVKLNANSRLSFANGWKDGRDREVWLSGEAFFHVRKTPLKSRFIVHTDHFDIIVTGTRFNVVNRNGQSNVMLAEGSIIVQDKDGNKLPMKTGEFVEFRKDEPRKRSVWSDSLLAWRDRRLVFENTQLKEVVRIIKMHYGVDIGLDNDSTGEKTISGMLPNDNLDVLLQSIDATNELKVIHQEGNIIFGSR